MNTLFKGSDKWLPGHYEPPCMSLYQPTHRKYPENNKDPIAFRNLVRETEKSLARRYPTRDIKPLMGPYNALAEDESFWNHTLDGLAVLGAPGFFRVYTLQHTVPELVVVANSFHIKPLLRVLQSADRYQVLAVTRKEVRLFEGTNNVLDEIEMAPGVPRTSIEALGDEHTEPHLTVASYGKGAGGPAMHHGHGSRKDEIDKDTERFLRVVDRGILEFHSQPSDLRLMLAALPEYHGLFQRISHNPFLMQQGINADPNALSTEELGRRAWEVVEPRYRRKLDGMVSRFSEAVSKGLAAAEPEDIAKEAVTGRVGTLLIDAERQVPGRIDPSTGAIEYDELEDPEVDDLLDDLGELVLQFGGQVLVVPSSRMPTESGAAAIFRY